jgi:hypothetical protein
MAAKDHGKHRRKGLERRQDADGRW